MTKNTKFLVLATLVSSTLLASCGKKQQRTMPTATFKTIKVETQDVTLSNKYSATIRGRQDIEVYPQVSGTLQQLCVTEGQHVSKGQTLFVIDQVPYKAALNTAKASLEAAKAQEATAKLNYESRKSLFEQKVISDFDLQTAQNALLTAKAQVAQATAQVVNAQNSLSYTIVKSPANGVVGTLPFRQGALVGPTIPQPLTTVSDNSQMYVYFSISEGQLLQLTRNNGSTKAAIEAIPAVQLILVDGSQYESAGKVESASGVVDTRTGSVQLRAVFDNAKGLLHSGSTGNVIVPTNYKNQIVVPTAATVQLQDKYRVYVVNKEGIAEERIVTLNPQSNGKQSIVTSGLKVGEEIVSEGAGMVKSGQKVK